MKIISQYNQINTNFKSFNISYNAEESLSKLPPIVLSRIAKLGKKVEKAEYIDIDLLSDLSFRIREKGKIFSGMKEPFTVVKPKAKEKRIKVSGIYDDIELPKQKRGSICHKYIEYSSAEEALKGYQIIQQSENDIDKIATIANEMEKEKILKAEHGYKSSERKILPLNQFLMNKYGDIIKEWKE